MGKILATKNVAAVLVGLALVFGFAFALATPAKADVLSDLQAQVQALLAQIAALQGTGGSQQTGGLACVTFTQNLTMGDSGGEVMSLQKFLNSVDGTQLATTGAGSPGNETSYFGAITKAAVVQFQNKFAAEVLAPVGLSAGTGYWGPSSRAHA
ncbi:MAG: peptidoglycan-binding protein, partial [bacterium]|nr:peptidoglycan-binding protein [bacterium]